jgi:hypothetical protein
MRELEDSEHELMEMSIDLSVAGLVIRRLIGKIEFDMMDLNKMERKRISGIIPKFRRCHSCGGLVLLKPWIKTYVFKKKFIYFHTGCFQKLEESFRVEGIRMKK